MAEDLTDPKPIAPEDKSLDKTLRPRFLSEYEGQDRLKKGLKIFLEAAKKRNESLDHVLFYGPPGLGKTTLAHILANEMDVNVRVTSGPALEHTGDLAAILTNLEDHDILFIDEIHRLNKAVEETMYPAMEDFCLDVVIGKGPSARTLRLGLPCFTVIGATTRIGLMTSPLRDRFGFTYRLDFYNLESLEKIIHRSSMILKIEIDSSAVYEIACRSRGTPRIANRLLKRVRDYAQVERDGIVTKDVVFEALKLLEVDSKGLDKTDRSLLLVLMEMFEGGPVGIETLAAAVNEDVGTIEEVVEPFLLQLGFIKRTPRGRMATELAYEHLEIKQNKLF